MDADIVKPTHVWIMSKLIDIQPKSLSLNDIIINICPSAISSIKSTEDFDRILNELVKWGYIKQPQRGFFDSQLSQEEEESQYKITSKGVLAFRLQITEPIIKICDKDIKGKKHLNTIKKILQDGDNIIKQVIIECLKDAVLVIELIKVLGNAVGS